ncbi:hypothetical protein CRG98_035043 [Punica granatum]|uniref:Uncharacterized protein n=1 Tax=Punica granatum TaxID=22663 RepID=A0A2I0IKN8_PUNGR|nr:hypothetical protein CRG98_035043 [Punica granatum]
MTGQSHSSYFHPHAGSVWLPLSRWSLYPASIHIAGKRRFPWKFFDILAAIVSPAQPQCGSFRSSAPAADSAGSRPRVMLIYLKILGLVSASGSPRSRHFLQRGRRSSFISRICQEGSGFEGFPRSGTLALVAADCS